MNTVRKLYRREGNASRFNRPQFVIYYKVG
jgi:hypothetical protein